MEEIFDTALAASQEGPPSPDLTILIGNENAISMISGSDWPLDSLALDRGAKSAYRVSGVPGGRIRVEGRHGLSRCVMESPSPAQTARLLLGR